MSERDYFDLKSFNYLRRNLDFSEFHQLALAADQEYLPFNLDEESHQRSFMRQAAA
jgi:hypothetical protein